MGGTEAVMPRIKTDERKDHERHPNETHAQEAQHRKEADRDASRRMQGNPQSKGR
jgi:hypothetical protein